MLSYFLAVLAACANATSSVLQRKANKKVPQNENLSWKLIRSLLHEPVWFGGILAVTVGFLLQASALGAGELAVVEPILVLELPLTLILAARVFGSSMGWREWAPTLAMTVGLAGLLYFLDPTPGRHGEVHPYVWIIGIGANLALVGALVAWGRKGPAGRGGGTGGSSAHQAAVFGVAGGSAFGLTAALMKGTTAHYANGFVTIFTSWQLYAMVAAGALGIFSGPVGSERRAADRGPARPHPVRPDHLDSVGRARLSRAGPGRPAPAAVRRAEHGPDGGRGVRAGPVAAAGRRQPAAGNAAVRAPESRPGRPRGPRLTGPPTGRRRRHGSRR
jgi:hypothetical protein